jgi:hypothetical protein
MHIREVDWRIGPLHDIIVGVDASIAAIRDRFDGEDTDGLAALEHVEPVLGLGFVAFQNYALGTWTDLNAIRKARRKPPVSKLDCYACDPIVLKGGATRIEVINATANCFKHHDEWSGWPTNETTRTLGRVGISQRSEFPCIKAARIFCGDSWELIVLHQIVRDWRTHVFKILR